MIAQLGIAVFGVLVLCALYTVSWARGLRMWREMA